jgi:uncharacterized protein with HEPN domain
LPFRHVEQHLRYILESINNIDTFLGDMDFDYRGDLKTKSAVEHGDTGDRRDILC